jgi:hypothetical protein
MATDAQLGRKGTRFTGWGAKVLLAAGVLAAIGLVLAFSADGTGAQIGVVIAWLALLPTMVGLALLLIGLVSVRASKQRPFA